MERHRSERLSEAIREELEEIISYELSDPRIDAQGVSEVLISPDARHAHVRVVLTGDPQSQQDTIEALNHARNYLKSELGRRLDVFRIPDLHFEAAIAADLGGRINHLLKRVKKGRPKEERNPTHTSEPPGNSPETSEKNQVP
jgi:ribosome-binding factor A